MPDRILGPLAPIVDDRVAVVDHGDRIELTALVDLDAVASGSFSRPAFGARFSLDGFTAPDVALVGFASTQFALPVRAEPGGRFEFRPAHNLRSPSVVLPLLLCADDGRVELLAPLDAFHEQVIGVRQDDTSITAFEWGWHGDLDTIPAGTSATLGVFTGTSAADAFARWGEAVQAAAGDRSADRSTRPSDPLLTHLSYWTDNGAAYWYRTEPDTDLTTTLADKLAELGRLGVGVGTVELDSWFYRHETTRSVSATGYLEEVPPTGMLEWTPRPDVLPDGIAPLRERLGTMPGTDEPRPLALHSRHISPASDYLTDTGSDTDSSEWRVDELAAHPITGSPAEAELFDRWCADAAAWGATCIEQDWMMMTFFGVREIRSHPGRVLAWQRALDDAAARHDLTLLWCMALPGDYAAAAGLGRVVAVRTSDDYRFAEDPALLWVWYLTVNVMADALGLPVFKDCFFSATPPAAGRAEPDPIDGDPHAELEALLSALSAGVVGIGDRLGRTDADVVRRIALPDGRLVGPDRAIRLTDASMADAGRTAGLCWAETSTTTPVGTWRYLVAINTSTDRATRTDRFGLDPDRRAVYDWRSGTVEVTDTVEITLGARDWALFVVCPGDPDGRVEIGDTSVYATMSPAVGDRPHTWWSAVDGLEVATVT